MAGTRPSTPDRPAPLAGDFPPATRAEWESLVRAKDPEASLVTTLDGGLELSWLYAPEDAPAPDPGGLPGEAPFTRGTRLGEPWAIRQENAAPTRRDANAQILEDLEGGATEILLRVDPEGRTGVPIADADQLGEVLDGVLLDLAPVALEAGAVALQAGEWLAEVWRRRDGPADTQRGSLRLDPIGTLAREGADEGALRTQLSAAAVAAARWRAEFPRVRTLAVDTAAHVEAGATAVDELAVALSTGIAYLRAGEEAGLGPEALSAALEMTLSASPDQFLEIAKYRAVRRLWSSVLAHCGVAPGGRHSTLYARTSRRMVSSLDPWVNLLRATTAAFAAGVGGADGVTVLPFDEARGEGLGRPGPLGRRLARNTQLVLLEESSLHRVADPAGGSWYVEALTDQLARRAWSALQALERDGGIVAAIGSGSLAERLAAAADRRHEEISRRRAILTGVNTFPLLGDDGLARDDDEPVALAGRRDASSFEHLRARAAEIAETTGREPAILLACMGSVASHVSIAMWATSFFESGGVRTIASGPQPDDEAQATLLREHGVGVAAICAGRDQTNEAKASLAATLRKAGAHTIFLPGGDDDAAHEAGADLGVRDGVDMVTVLGDLLSRIEAAQVTKTR